MPAVEVGKHQERQMPNTVFANLAILHSLCYIQLQYLKHLSKDHNQWQDCIFFNTVECY